jgi:hypothetical protein
MFAIRFPTVRRHLIYGQRGLNRRTQKSTNVNMTPKLTSEQRDALNQQGSPLVIEDDETRRFYFLVDPAMLESLREQSDIAAILQGISDADSGKVQPLDDAIRQIEIRLRARFGT